MTRVDRIVARLREGPATAIQLIEDCHLTDYPSAIRDARRAGHRIDCDRRKRGRTVVWEYSLFPAEEVLARFDGWAFPPRGPTFGCVYVPVVEPTRPTFPDIGSDKQADGSPKWWAVETKR